MGKQIFDVCIVGSGPGGGIAAYALTKAGLKVALVEAGRRLQPGVDYGLHAWPWEHVEARRAGQPLPGFRFEQNHFTPVGDRPRHGWLKALGGRSLCWAGHSLRFGPLDFKPWPISYDEVAPYYSRAERFMGVYGDKDGLWNMPDGEFQKGVPMRCPEAALKRGVEKLKAKGRRMEFIALRKAILTEQHESKRPVCHYCGKCMQGCDVDSKYTSANTPIPLAMKIRANGGEVIASFSHVAADDLVIDGNHWVGSARMGADAMTSVVNSSCQSHEIPNLFIGDASVFTTYPEKNPTLTSIALSWRMSERLAEKFKRGEI